MNKWEHSSTRLCWHSVSAGTDAIPSKKKLMVVVQSTKTVHLTVRSIGTCLRCESQMWVRHNVKPSHDHGMRGGIIIIDGRAGIGANAKGAAGFMQF